MLIDAGELLHLLIERELGDPSDALVVPASAYFAVSVLLLGDDIA